MTLLFCGNPKIFLEELVTFNGAGNAAVGIFGESSWCHLGLGQSLEGAGIEISPGKNRTFTKTSDGKPKYIGDLKSKGGGRVFHWLSQISSHILANNLGHVT